MTMTREKIEELKRLAENATPGQWNWWTSNSFRRLSSGRAGNVDGDVLHATVHPIDRHPDIVVSQENMDFIAALNPETALALLALAERALEPQVAIGKPVDCSDDFARYPQPQGQALPVAWQVWWGLMEKKPVWPPFATEDEAKQRAAQIKSNTEIRPLYASQLTLPAGLAPESFPRIAEWKHGGEWFEATSVDEMQAFYLSRLPAIREAAKELGYAIGLHGSTRRDFDLMAMQWREGAAVKDELANAIATAACGIGRDSPYQWEKKPLGRVATSIPICWTTWHDMISAGHIDLSIIDLANRPSDEWYRQKFARWGDNEPAVIGGAHSSPSPAVAQPVANEEAILDAIAEQLKGLYVCNRVWEAWSYGTMRQEDFSPAWEDDNVIHDIADAVATARAALCQPADEGGKS